MRDMFFSGCPIFNEAKLPWSVSLEHVLQVGGTSLKEVCLAPRPRASGGSFQINGG